MFAGGGQKLGGKENGISRLLVIKDPQSDSSPDLPIPSVKPERDERLLPILPWMDRGDPSVKQQKDRGVPPVKPQMVTGIEVLFTVKHTSDSSKTSTNREFMRKVRKGSIREVECITLD